MNIILDEKKMAMDLIAKGEVTDKPTDTIRVLIKYYHSMGMDNDQVRDNIEDFMNKNYQGFNAAKWQNILDGMTKKFASDKYKLVHIDRVKITEEELRYISSIGNPKLERLAFTLLVYAKIHNQLYEENNNWVNEPCKEIFKDAKIIESCIKQQLSINKLSKLGAVEIAKVVDSNGIRVRFLNGESKVIIDLTDFREFVLAYLEWKGEKIGHCSECGKKIKLKGKNNKYCKKCSSKKRLERQRKYMQNV